MGGVSVSPTGAAQARLTFRTCESCGDGIGANWKGAMCPRCTGALGADSNQRRYVTISQLAKELDTTPNIIIGAVASGELKERKRTVNGVRTTVVQRQASYPFLERRTRTTGRKEGEEEQRRRESTAAFKERTAARYAERVKETPIGPIRSMVVENAAEVDVKLLLYFADEVHAALELMAGADGKLLEYLISQAARANEMLVQYLKERQ